MAKKDKTEMTINEVEDKWISLQEKRILKKLSKDEKKEFDKLRSRLVKEDKFYTADNYLLEQFGEDHNDTIEDDDVYISTESFSQDAAMRGGFLCGRVYELFGLEGSAKTTTTLHAVKKAQEIFHDKKAVYIDYEHTFHKKYSTRIGLNLSPKKFKLLQPKYLEQGMESAIKYAESGRVSIIIVDSVAAMLPKSEMEGTMDNQQMGAQARAIGKAFRKLVGVLRKNKVCMIFINQLRDKIGGYGGKITPGGRALKFFASMRIEMKKLKTETTHVRIGMKVVKSKVGGQLSEAFFDVNENGIMMESQALDYAMEFGWVKKGGAWFQFGELKKLQGRDNALKFLRGNPALMFKMLENIKPRLEDLEIEKKKKEEESLEKLRIVEFSAKEIDISLEDMLKGKLSIDESMIENMSTEELFKDEESTLKMSAKFDAEVNSDADDLSPEIVELDKELFEDSKEKKEEKKEEIKEEDKK